MFFDFDEFKVVTFDCYGTLIDWESGILAAIRPALQSHGQHLDDIPLLQMYGQIEAETERQDYRPYRQILRDVVAGYGLRLGFTPTNAEMESLPDSLASWKPFPDTVPALRLLKKNYKLGIISNIDDHLFAASAKQLEIPFDFVVTAEEARSYKPSRNNFHIALFKAGIQPEQLLHVAESLYHDVEPAKSLGISTVWVNRVTKCGDFGATLPANEFPDMQAPDLISLARLAVED